MYSGGSVIVLDNFRRTTPFGVRGINKLKTRLNKGHERQFELFVNQIKDGGDPLIPADQLFNSSEAAIAAVESLQSGTWVNV